MTERSEHFKKTAFKLGSAIAALTILPSCDGILVDPNAHSNDPNVVEALNVRKTNEAYLEPLDPVATFPAPSSDSPKILTNDYFKCAEVVDGGSVSQAMMDANGGSLPGPTFGGVELQVQITHDGEQTVQPYLDIFSKDPIVVYPGDEVCVSARPFPTSTPMPQSSLEKPYRPGQIHQHGGPRQTNFKRG
jgi:hypothetical protein